MFKVICVLFLITINFVGAQNDDIVPKFNLEELKAIGKTIGMKIFFDPSKCASDIIKVYNGVKNKEMWALRMIDATSKLQPALLEGNLMGLGSSNECIETKVGKSYGNFSGKYCLAFIPVPEAVGSHFHVNPEYLKKVSVRWGVCIPSTCKAEDLSFYISPLTSKYNFTVNFTNERCYTIEELPISTLDIVALCIFGTVFLMVILSTIYEKFIDTYGFKPASHDIFQAFSLGTNLKDLFKVQSKSKNRQVIHSLIGIRVLSLTWIIISHKTLTLFLSPMINLKTAVDHIKKFDGQIFMGGVFAVDSFLLLSGILVSYILLNKFKNGIKLPQIPMIYLLRYLRLTPPYAAMILFQMSLARHVSKGPMWNDVWQFWSGVCSKYWWSALTYVQNYVNPNQICLGQTWYLSVDTQLFWMAPFLLILFHKSRRLTYPVISFLIAVQVVVTFLIAYVYEIPAAANGAKPLLRESLLYMPTHTRAGPWLIGLALGYHFYGNKGRIIIIPKAVVATCWILTLVAINGCIFGMWFFVQPDNVYNPFNDSFYLGFTRTFWGLALAWVIIACENGYAGPINSVLSWKYFQPLARLTYSQYLVHSSYQRMMMGSIQTPIYENNFLLVTHGVSDIVMTYIFAIVLYVTFEAPVMKIMDIAFRKERTIERCPESPKESTNKQV